MKIKMLILILPSFFKFLIFPSVTPVYNIETFFIGFLRIYLIKDHEIQQFCLFSESVTTSDGYRRGYVSFAHFLFLFLYAFTASGPRAGLVLKPEPERREFQLPPRGLADVSALENNV